MKRILFILLLLPFFANAQKPRNFEKGHKGYQNLYVEALQTPSLGHKSTPLSTDSISLIDNAGNHYKIDIDDLFNVTRVVGKDSTIYYIGGVRFAIKDSTGITVVSSGGQTNITGLIKGNGSTLSAASHPTDYISPSERISDLTAPNADYSFNNHKITNLTDPTSDQDAATKIYVDNTSANRVVKDSVRAATVSAGTLASSFENGDAIDGVTLSTGNRILIKNQAAGAENGIYTVNASGAPTRATDFDASGEVAAGATTFVTSGTTNANTQWTQSTTGTITVGTTAMSFVQIGNTTIADNSVTDIKLRQSAGLSVIGRSANSTGNVADITAGTDKHVLRRSGTSIGFGTIDSTSVPDLHSNGYYDGKYQIIGSYQPLDADLTTIAGLTATTDNFMVSVSSAWASRTPAQVKTTLALNNVDNTSDATKNSATATLTNKRIQPRADSTTSSATPTINTDNIDLYFITAQTVDITSMSTNLSGTPLKGEEIEIWITGTASRAITWGAKFQASSVALPTTTSGTATLHCRFVRENNIWTIKGYY